ncbi:MAG: alpha/beta hydrolase [Alphaproteobacteria bacterium]|nr:alpha/beta hydrolase [Alphaproteobacteria bacterium]
MKIRCGYVDTARGQLHYRSSGERGPFVFLFHQTPLSSRMYERCLPHLGRYCRAVAFDTPGYGASDPPPGVPTVSDYASRLLEGIGALGADRFAVAGFATGSAVSLEIAMQAGPRVTHGVFSGMPLLSAARLRQFGLALGEASVKADGSHVLRVWEARTANYGPSNDLEQIQVAVAETLRVYERMNWGLLAVGQYDLRRSLQSLACPVLFLTAEHDKLAPENAAAAALIKGAQFAQFADVMPQLCWTVPQRYADTVAEFIGAKPR